MKRASSKQSETVKKQKIAHYGLESFVSLIPKDVLLDCIVPLLQFRDVITMERISKIDREFFSSDRVWNIFYKQGLPILPQVYDDAYPVWDEELDPNFVLTDALEPVGDPLRPGTMYLQCKLLDGHPVLDGPFEECLSAHIRDYDLNSGEYSKFSWMDENKAFKMFKQERQYAISSLSNVEQSITSTKELYKKEYIRRIKQKYYWNIVGCADIDTIHGYHWEIEMDFPALKECHCEDSHYLHIFNNAPSWILISFYMMLCAEMDGHGLLAQYLLVDTGEEEPECQLCTQDEMMEDEQEEECPHLSDREDEEETETMLICDGCEQGFHLACLKLDDVPQEEKWYCIACEKDEEKTIPRKMCFHEQIKKGLDEAKGYWSNKAYSPAMSWMGHPLHFAPAEELRTIREVLEANFGYLVYYRMDDMEAFIPDGIEADLWPYHFAVQEIERGYTDEHSIVNSVHKIMRKSCLKKCDPYTAHSSVDGMTQFLRTIIETADLIKNDQTQNDVNEEITADHIKQAIEELDMSFYDRGVKEVSNDTQSEPSTAEQELESKATDEVELEQKLFSLAEEIYKRHNMEFPLKEGEDFWTCFQSVLTNYVLGEKQEEDELSDQESEENQNDNNVNEDCESESQDDEEKEEQDHNSTEEFKDYNRDEEEVIKGIMKEDMKEYGCWDYFEDSEDDTTEVTEMHKLRYELREAVEKMLNEHFGIEMEE